MLLSQMKHEAKYQIFIPRIWCFWHLRSSSGGMHWMSWGCKSSNFFLKNNLGDFVSCKHTDNKPNNNFTKIQSENV